VSDVNSSTVQLVAQVVRKCIEEGFTIEIEGLGVFCPDRSGGIQFVPEVRQKAFIAYVEEDLPAAERLYSALAALGFDPWLDKKRLLPGQNWPRSIERIIEISDFFLACFSRRAAGKRGYFQSELRYALDCATRMPLGQIFFIPVRLDDCRLPSQISRQFQYVDLFPEWDRGFDRIVSVMRKAAKKGGQRAA
jgi:hypothetical protein